MKFLDDNGALVFYQNGEMGRIEAWGKDSVRVRTTMLGRFDGNDWALTENVENTDSRVKIEKEDHWVGDEPLIREKLHQSPMDVLK